MRVALATCAELPHLDSDEALLVHELRARGVEVTHPVWDAGDAPFLAADLTVIRSTWDYTTKVDSFVAWAERIERTTAGRLCNPASVVSWSSHKRYLLELQDKGVAIVPTLFLPAGSTCDLERLVREAGWRRGVVAKPAVSAGSRDSIMITDEGVPSAQDYFDRLLPTRDLLVQPFVPGIVDGEVSLIYLVTDGALRYAHAVIKEPAPGDFRSQPEFRAQVAAAEPAPAWRAAADQILSHVKDELLYARVDLVAGDHGAPWLMELELVEPSLYLAWCPSSAAHLADAIVERGVSRSPHRSR